MSRNNPKTACSPVCKQGPKASNREKSAAHSLQARKPHLHLACISEALRSQVPFGLEIHLKASMLLTMFLGGQGGQHCWKDPTCFDHHDADGHG